MKRESAIEMEEVIGISLLYVTQIMTRQFVIFLTGGKDILIGEGIVHFSRLETAIGVQVKKALLQENNDTEN